MLDRLERQLHASGGEARLAELYQELVAYPATNDLIDSAQQGQPSPQDQPDDDEVFADVFVPLRILYDDDRELSLFSTVTTFGTPRDITVEELHIENFYPVDTATEKFLRSRQ